GNPVPASSLPPRAPPPRRVHRAALVPPPAEIVRVDRREPVEQVLRRARVVADLEPGPRTEAEDRDVAPRAVAVLLALEVGARGRVEPSADRLLLARRRELHDVAEQVPAAHLVRGDVAAEPQRVVPHRRVVPPAV